ncbi:TPA: superoxide dismutase [bacterium]|jgi:Fe-Mn family superoxide dismutase|nr:superoxide dismutase [bacterium]
MKNTYPFKKIELPYAYDALEPYIDKETMMLHHQKHHQAYENNLNDALKDYPELHDRTLEELLTNLEDLPEAIRTKVRNNGGGVYNHNVYFAVMGPTNHEVKGNVKVAIEKKFGSFENFKKEFKAAGLGRFGSGWAMLVKTREGDVEIITTPNQDVPNLNEVVVLLPMDVWEHAYYLKYQNKRGDYIDNFFNVVNWDEVERRFNTSNTINDFRYDI